MSPRQAWVGIRRFTAASLFVGFECTDSVLALKVLSVWVSAPLNLSSASSSQVKCKASIAFVQYSVLANFYWLLVEGMYLQTLLLLTFTSDRSYIWCYILTGWGEPVTLTPLGAPRVQPRSWVRCRNGPGGDASPSMAIIPL